MTIYFLFVAIVVSGFLVGFKKEKRFCLLKATVFVGAETLIGSLLFFLIMLLISQTFLKHVFLADFSSLFVVILFVAVIDGFILYWINRFLIPKFSIGKLTQTLSEYIIQWSLIYITIYQIVFEYIKLDISEAKLESLSLTNPSDVAIMVLPTLISVWIAIILHRINTDTI